MAKEATRNAYGKALAELVVERDDVLVLDADLTKSTKTIDAKKARPEHHFNMGIAEGNMMAVAAGMAASNKVVYASSFAMFAAGRAFEQIRNSICYPNLNVKVCATHAGITVGEDGASHQCIEDITSHYVTYGDVRATFQGGRYANGQFRGGSSESYDSQADYDGRNTESLGYGRSTICQAVGTYQNEE